MSKINNGRRRDPEGFTLVELLMVMIIVGILSTFAALYLTDMRKRARDSQAYGEGRNLVTALNDTFLSNEDVYFGDGVTEFTGNVGEWNSDLSATRDPIFKLSNLVMARMDGSTDSGYAQVYIWNINGTADSFATNTAKKKEFIYLIDENTGTISMPNF